MLTDLVLSRTCSWFLLVPRAAAQKSPHRRPNAAFDEEYGASLHRVAAYRAGYTRRAPRTRTATSATANCLAWRVPSALELGIDYFRTDAVIGGVHFMQRKPRGPKWSGSGVRRAHRDDNPSTPTWCTTGGDFRQEEDRIRPDQPAHFSPQLPGQAQPKS